jgi:hypothetical protein
MPRPRKSVGVRRAMEEGMEEGTEEGDGGEAAGRSPTDGNLRSLESSTGTALRFRKAPIVVRIFHASSLHRS